MMFRNIRVFILLVVFISCSNNNKDVKTTNRDIAFLQKEFIRVFDENKDSTSYFLNQVDKLISPETPDSLKQEYFYQKGLSNYKISKNIDTAFYFLEKAISFSKDSITNKRELNYYYNLAKYYHQQKQNEDAIYTLNRFENILNKNENLRELGYVYNLKTQIFESIGALDSAYYINKKTINNFRLLRDTTNMVITSINNVYFAINFLNENKKPIKIIDSLRSLKINNYYLKSLIDFTSGDVFFNRRDYNQANNMYLNAYKNIIKSGRSDKNSYTIKILNKYYKSLLYSNNEYNFNQYLNQIDSLKGDYISTIEYKEYLKNKLHFTFLKSKSFINVEKELDSFYDFLLSDINKKKEAKFLALEKANKKEKKLLIERQKIELINKTLKQKQLILFGFLFFFLLAMVIAYLFYQRKKLKQSRDALLMQQRLFRAQMNPHFTSNIMFAIQNLIKKDPIKMEQYLLKFSRLLRVILENSTKNYVSVEAEIEALEKYLDLQQLRFKNKFEYKINIDNNIELDLIKIPPMLIQPFVENSLEHGFKSIDYIGKIIIELQLNNGFIDCVIKDNGIGFYEENKEQKVSSILLIKSLIKKMTGTSVQIDSIKNNGMRIRFKIPFITEL